jgi:inward rectifier potassium channel
MALLKRINPFLKSNNDTGFSTSTSIVGGRFINKDGSFNVRKDGIPFWKRISIYHTMLNMPRWKFITVVVVFFHLINLLYTSIYLLIGPQQFTGMISGAELQVFKELYFFSTETFTTVGYGRVNPIGDAANLVASIEAMTGFLSFAIATGLIYGRFSKPKAYLLFSEHALISPYQEKTALMLRLAPYKDDHTLTSVEVTVNIGMQVQENEKPVYKFYTLPLERKHVDSLPMSWTVVHPIDEHSPLYELSVDDIKLADLEIYVSIRGFDDVYSNIVLQRTSYTYEEIIYNAKFTIMSKESEDGNTTILELDKLNEYRKL